MATTFGIQKSDNANQDQDMNAGGIPLTQLLMIIGGGNMRKFSPVKVVDLLESVKGDKRAHEEPGSSDQAAKKTLF